MSDIEKNPLETSGDAHIAAELAAREELARYNTEVDELVIHIEDYMIAKDLTNGHLNSAVEAFNRRNSIVVPMLKMKAMKTLFEDINEHSDVRRRSA